MRIDELDEFQGLTPDMVRAWLANLDPSIKPSACIGGDIEAVSELCGETSQSLLREINPRMRKGMPSQAALAAHNHWLVRDTETGEISLHRAEGGNLYSVIHYRNGTKNPDSEALPDFGTWMEFWPCDEHGNKVRWPTDAQGNML